METKKYHIICTGLQKPDLNHAFDESNLYLPEIIEHQFFGTLDEARDKGRKFANIRWEGDYQRSPFARISYWIKDEKNTFYDNNMRRKILFVCSANADRSKTAELVVRELDPDVETKSAGTAHYAQTPISKELIVWADAILVMEYHHLSVLRFRYGGLVEGKVHIMNIPDDFTYMEPTLIARIKIAWQIFIK